MSGTLNGIENARFLLDRWTESLAQVLESMTDQRPEVRWEAVSGLAGTSGSRPGLSVVGTAVPGGSRRPHSGSARRRPSGNMPGP